MLEYFLGKRGKKKSKITISTHHLNFNKGIEKKMPGNSFPEFKICKLFIKLLKFK